MTKRNIAASANMEGMTLSTGWKVIKPLDRGDTATGGHFSNAYVVSKDGQKGFMKAFDFSDAFLAANVLEELQKLTTAYVYERDLLLHCKGRKLNKVVIALDHGEAQVPNYDQMNGRVFYLVFQLADGDMRGQVRQDKRFDTLWSIRALRDVTVGMYQVHRQMIAHQDLKPSNVLLFGAEFRLADFGRASRKGYPAVHDDLSVAGDRTYAPPEQLYGFRHEEFTVRRFGCDLYMLGNLAAFMFAGINVTGHINTYLDPQFHPQNWAKPYADVLPQLQTVYPIVIADIRAAIDHIATDLVIPLITELCEPDIARRGHPKGVGRYDQYSLERYVSRLDIVVRQIEFRMRTSRKTG